MFGLYLDARSRKSLPSKTSAEQNWDDILNCLEGLPAQSFGRTCLHPRLNQPMRLVDLLCFTAQHDDYHLARVRQLVRKFEPNSRTDR